MADQGIEIAGADPTEAFGKCLEIANGIAAQVNWYCFAVASYSASPLVPVAEKRIRKDTADVLQTAKLLIPATEDLIKFGKAFAHNQQGQLG